MTAHNSTSALSRRSQIPLVLALTMIPYGIYMLLTFAFPLENPHLFVNILYAFEIGILVRSAF